LAAQKFQVFAGVLELLLAVTAGLKLSYYYVKQDANPLDTKFVEK
jgi:hypothetical protein